MRAVLIGSLFFLLFSPASFAGEADVIKVVIEKQGDTTYRFDITVTHRDEGWEHYADRWDILAPDDSLLGSRTLYHPHVDEQPFTRSLPDVEIPAGVRAVTVRAHDSVHGYGGKIQSAELPR